MGQKLSQHWNQPVIIESKPGAAGSIGMEFAARQAADGYTFVNGNLGPAGYYPNSLGRKDMDASRAMVNEYGEGDANGTHSRYSNIEVPIYNLTGWYDIFIDGQIESRNYVEKHVSNTYGNKNLQKIVVKNPTWHIKLMYTCVSPFLSTKVNSMVEFKYDSAL